MNIIKYWTHMYRGTWWCIKLVDCSNACAIVFIILNFLGGASLSLHEGWLFNYFSCTCDRCEVAQLMCYTVATYVTNAVHMYTTKNCLCCNVIWRVTMWFVVDTMQYLAMTGIVTQVISITMILSTFISDDTPTKIMSWYYYDFHGCIIRNECWYIMIVSL